MSLNVLTENFKGFVMKEFLQHARDSLVNIDIESLVLLISSYMGECSTGDTMLKESSPKKSKKSKKLNKETPEFSRMPLVQENKCMARKWCDGLGFQCSCKPSDGSDFCKTHGKTLNDEGIPSFGRIDLPRIRHRTDNGNDCGWKHFSGDGEVECIVIEEQVNQSDDIIDDGASTASTEEMLEDVPSPITEPDTLQAEDEQVSIPEVAEVQQVSIPDVAEVQVSIQEVAEVKKSIQEQDDQVSIQEVSDEQVSSPDVALDQVSIPEVAEEQVSIQEVAEEQVSSPDVVEEQVSIPEVAEEQVSIQEVAEEQVSNENTDQGLFGIVQGVRYKFKLEDNNEFTIWDGELRVGDYDGEDVTFTEAFRKFHNLQVTDEDQEEEVIWEE